jgi:hypothetical protein
MRALTLLVVALLAVSTFAFLATAPPAQAATTYLNDRLIVSSGSTSAFGGGDYRFIQFGSDAAFGIVWGNATHANNIYVAAIKTRYLGVGQVYFGANGTRLAANQPIKVYTIYAAQLQNLTEYRDNTGDGVANYTRTYNATTHTWSNYAFTGDVGYKFVNLSTNWIPSSVTNTTGSTYRTWTFSLNATNLAYYNITNKRKLPGSVPIVNYTFHLNASLVQDTNVSVPQWNVTVTRILGHDIVSSVVKMQDLVLASVKTVHYALKWDQLISGWAYDNRNNNLALRRLLLEVGSIVVNYVPAGVVEGWRLLVHQLGDDGRATYTTAAGNQTVDNTTPTYSGPRVFKSPNLDFGGAWTRIARFLWSSNDTVDRATSAVLGQVEGAWAFLYLDTRGVFYGFVMLVGLNYVGGVTIIHDPTVSADVMTDLQYQSASTPPAGTTSPANFGTVLVGLVLLVVLVLVAYAMIVRGRKKTEPPVQPPVRPPVQPPQP